MFPRRVRAFGPAERAIYEKAVARAWEYYRELTRVLEPSAREILSDIWHVSDMSHPRRVQKVARQSEKRAIEVARYVLPVAAFTTMVHTLSGIVLHRLRRMQAANDTPSEARLVIGEMVERVREIDPQFFDRFDNEPMQDPPEWNHGAERTAKLSRANSMSDLAGLTSRLTDYSPRAMEAMAQAYRAVMGLTAAECPDAEALDRDFESGAQSLSPRDAERRRARADDAASRSRTFYVCEENQPHGRQPGPAAPDGSGFAPASDARRYALARLHHAAC